MAAITALEADYQTRLAEWKKSRSIGVSDESELFSADRVQQVATKSKSATTKKRNTGKVQVTLRKFAIEWETHKGVWRYTEIEGEDSKDAKQRLARKHKCLCLIFTVVEL